MFFPGRGNETPAMNAASNAIAAPSATRKVDICSACWNGARRNGHATAPTLQEKFNSASAEALRPGFTSATSRLAVGIASPNPTP